MSCNCKPNTNPKNCPEHKLSLAIEGTYIIGSYLGVPIKPVDITDAVIAAQSQTRLSIDTDTNELVFQSESSEGEEVVDRISLSNLFAEAELGDLSDVDDTNPSDGAFLIFDSQLGKYKPYSIATGQPVAALGVDERGRPVKTSSQQQQVIGYPIGAEFAWSGDESNLPAGCVIADGRELSRTTYAAAYAIMGTRYGVGDGTKTFNIPDLRGRVIAGRQTGSADFGMLGQKSGLLTVDTTHQHIMPFGWDGGRYYAVQADNGFPQYGSDVIQAGGFSFPTSEFAARGLRRAFTSPGGQTALPVVQPTLTQLWIIRIA